MKMQAVSVSVGVLLLAGGAGIAIGQGEDSAPSAATVVATAVSVAPATGSAPPSDASATQEDAVSLLRGAPVQLSPKSTVIATPDMVWSRGVNVDLGHVVQTDVGPISVAPAADDLVCYGTSSGGGCGTSAEIRSGKGIGVQLCNPDSPGIRAFGLVPDGATDGRALLQNGSSQPLDITSNVVGAVLRGVPAGFAYDLNGKTVRWEIALPAGDADGCIQGSSS
jgi:hypothetical protein